MFSFIFNSRVTDLPFDLVSCAEPFSGTICLYNRDRREKLSEDFYFHILPTEMQNVRRNVYYSLLCHYFYPLIQIIDHFQLLSYFIRLIFLWTVGVFFHWMSLHHQSAF